MKPALLQISKKTVFSKVLEYLPNRSNMSLAEILRIDQDIVQVYNNKDIELFG